MADYLAPQFKGMHLEDFGKRAKTIEDIKNVMEANRKQSDNDENIDEQETEFGDINLSPTSEKQTDRSILTTEDG